MGELSRRVPQSLREASERGDLYLAQCHRRFPGIVTWLLTDDVAGARAEVQKSRALQPPSEFHIGHAWNVIADRQIDLYLGETGEAWDKTVAEWPHMRAMSRVQLLRIEALFLRGRVAVAARRSPQIALDDARRLDGEKLPWASALAALLRACAAGGDRDKAVKLLTTAVQQLDGAELTLFAHCARYRLGQLLGGDAGSALSAAATAWMRDQSIGNPERMMAVFAPGFG
jgi:hypothetical protein